MAGRRRSRKKWSNRIWAIGAVVVAGIAGLAAFTDHIVRIKNGLVMIGAAFFGNAPKIDVLVDRNSIQFRPRTIPAIDLRVPDAPADWIDSPLMIVMTIAYVHRSPEAARAQAVREEVTLEFGAASKQYHWAFKVEAFAGKSCPDSLCIIGNIEPDDVEPGKASLSRETLFRSGDVQPTSWKTFIDQVLAPDGPRTAKVTLRSSVLVSDGKGGTPTIYRTDCTIDVAKARAAFGKFKHGQNPRPTFWNASCEPA